MPRRQLPTGFTAGRKLNLAGTVYAEGATIPPAVVAGTKGVNNLLARRWIVPANEAYDVKRFIGRSRNPKPLYLSPQEIRTLLAS